MDYKFIVAEKLLEIKAIKLNPQNPFTWASGIKSPIYCDNRITLSYPKVRNIIKEGFTELAEEFPTVDAIAGVATAGIAHGALLADALDLPYLYVRSKPKGHGRQNQIEGELKPGSKVLVIEDLISTGGSSIRAVDVLRQAGAGVLAVLAIFSYNFSLAKDNFEKSVCPFRAICDYDTLLSTALKNNYISKEDKVTLDQWNKDPQYWFEKMTLEQNN